MELMNVAMYIVTNSIHSYRGKTNEIIEKVKKGKWKQAT